MMEEKIRVDDMLTEGSCMGADESTALFIDEYLGKIFYFCLKKVGNEYDAEELSQDIALSILSSLRRGSIPESFSAWVWKIARNRYSRFMDSKRRMFESFYADDIGEFDIIDTSRDTLDEMILSEDISALRRELAFISSDYRNIIVAYYFEDRPIREIAEILSLSADAVKQRLRRARIILKEGMKMAREFGKRSYSPEQINFVMDGKQGDHGQPWSIITHLLYKNIFLEVYENPQTAESLSIELGVALPYMEYELEFLVTEDLLRKHGDKYETNFPIISREEQDKTHEKHLSITPELTKKLCEIVDFYMAEDGAKVDCSHVGYEVAKWALLMKLFDRVVWNANGRIQGSHPERPDNGRWGLTGYELVEYDEPKFVGQHGIYTKNQIELNDLIEHFDFGQYKFYYGNHQAKTPEFLDYEEGRTLWFICDGKISECKQDYINNLLGYGYLKELSGIIEPNVVILRGAEPKCSAEAGEKLSALYKESIEIAMKSSTIARGYVLEQAIKYGWLVYSDDMMPSVGAYIYL